ncbi:hypothetical protein [Bradyrhizobium genosp. P]|uniref:hypothetical protein n=1 Tax=Bradyrhizobium genosp. P TaxID=83641 RepID=UPI003CF79CA5
MRIIELRPPRPGAAAGAIAHVDIEFDPGIRLYGLRVSRAPDGSFRVFGLSNDHGRTCAFDRDAIEAIANATLKFMTMNGPSHNARLAAR